MLCAAQAPCIEGLEWWICDTFEWSQWLREWKKREVFFRCVQATVKQIARQKPWASFPLQWILFVFVLSAALTNISCIDIARSKIVNATRKQYMLAPLRRIFLLDCIILPMCLYIVVWLINGGWGNLECYNLQQLLAKIMFRLVIIK